MAFHVGRANRANSVGRDPTVWVLEDDTTSGCLEVWPASGFNAYRWRVGDDELLYRDPAFFDGAKPTRSGWPILFPFPNRIRDGRFTWDGRAYHLPTGDSSGKNAIHGFAVHRPWRVVDHGADILGAWVSAEFQASRDAADVAHLWPGDYRLRITYRLSSASLRVEATVDNPGTTPLPFGLGYHPYFRAAPFGGEEVTIDIEAGKQWKLVDCLPTGETTVVSWIRHEQRLANVQLDHLFTEVPLSRPDARQCGALQSDQGKRLVVQASRDFRELVVFTPPHRQAICLEPYTCITDAINLQQQGVDAGLLVLAPGATWQGWVEVMLIQEPTPAA
jgi:aldose 1-epimerase